MKLISKIFFITCMLAVLTSCGGKSGNGDRGYSSSDTGANSEFAFKADFNLLDLTDINVVSKIAGDKIYYVEYTTIGGDNSGGGIDIMPMPRVKVAVNTDEIVADSASDEDSALDEDSAEDSASDESVADDAEKPADSQKIAADAPMRDTAYTDAVNICKLFYYNITTKQKEEVPYTLPENANISQLNADDAGNIYFLVNVYDPNANDGNGKDLLNLVKLDTNYQEVFNLDLTKTSDADYFYINRSYLDGKGNFYFIDSDNHTAVIDAAGQVLGKFELKPTEDENYTMIIASGTGDIYLVKEGGTQTPNGYKGSISVAKADYAAKTLGTEMLIGESDIWFRMVTPVPGENAVFINLGNYFAKLDLTTGKLQTQFLWINIDIGADYVNSVIAKDGEHYEALLNKYSESGTTYEIASITKVKASELPKKKIITYGLPNGYINYQDDILSFNRQNDEYRIEVVTYQNGSDEENLKRLSMDLASGRAPDIIEWPVNMDVLQFGTKGTLADIGKLIDSDSEIKREDFLPGVLEAYTNNGKIYALPNYVYLTSLFAAKGAPNVKEGWDVDSFLQFIKSRQTNAPVIPYMDTTTAPGRFTENAYASFINWDTGVCSFDSPSYIGLLELSKAFPEKSDDEYMDYSGYYAQGQMLFDSYLYSIGSMENLYDTFKDGFMNLGYPANDQSNGAVMQSTGVYLVISAKSKNIDGAWQFMREQYRYDHLIQNLNQYGMAVITKAFDAQVAQYFKEITKREEENRNFGLTVKYATQEDADWMKELIAHSRPRQYIPPQVTNIITDEALKYFNGQISAEEAAKNTQNRVKLYVDENS